jgi:hypothetical protein
MQGYFNIKAYGEFAAENRPAGWNAWLTDFADRAHQHGRTDAASRDEITRSINYQRSRAMKIERMPTLLAAVVVGTLASTAAHAQTAPKMKMTTDIPASITTPDSVETRLGTFKFRDGVPDDATIQTV